MSPAEIREMKDAHYVVFVNLSVLAKQRPVDLQDVWSRRRGAVLGTVFLPLSLKPRFTLKCRLEFSEGQN